MTLWQVNMQKCMPGSRNTAEKRKIAKYEGLSQFVFYPVAVETLGSWCVVSKKFIPDIGSRIAAINGEKVRFIPFPKIVSSSSKRKCCCNSGHVAQIKKTRRDLQSILIEILTMRTLRYDVLCQSRLILTLTEQYNLIMLAK